jgi:hypothetical protein
MPFESLLILFEKKKKNNKFCLKAFAFHFEITKRVCVYVFLS